MKHIINLVLIIFFISSVTAQNEKFETLFAEYSKHSISFENPKLEEYSENLAQIQYAICGRKLSGTKLENKLEALSKEYGRFIKYMSKNDQENFTKTFDLINKGYENCIQQQNNKILKTLLRKQEKELKKVIVNVKPSFESNEFEKFANKMIDILNKQYSQNTGFKEYNLKIEELKKEYANAIKTVSKSDNETLSLLIQNTVY